MVKCEWSHRFGDEVEKAFGFSKPGDRAVALWRDIKRNTTKRQK
jgi:hypothetical protein